MSVTDFSDSSATAVSDAEPNRTMEVGVEVVAEKWRCEHQNIHKLDKKGVDHCLCKTHGTDTGNGHCPTCGLDAAPPEAKVHQRLSSIEELLGKIAAGMDANQAIRDWHK